MSYCVNCGVELEESVAKCPLCQTPVINPNIIALPNKPSAYPERIYMPKALNRRFGAFIASMVILLPTIVCLLVNRLFYPRMDWGWVVLATGFMIWVVGVSPFFWKKTVSWALILIDSVCIMGYAGVLCMLTGNKQAFLECVLPIIGVATVIIGFFIEFRRLVKPGWPVLCIAIFSEVLVSSLCIELIVRNYLDINLLPAYALIISACCAAVTAFFIAVATNKKLRIWMDRRFFVE